MSERTDAIYRLSHTADAFRGQGDTIVIEAEEAVLIVQDAEAESERFRNGYAFATESADAATEAVAAMAVKMRAAVAENMRLRDVVEAARILRDVLAADHEWKGYTVDQCYADLFAALDGLEAT